MQCVKQQQMVFFARSGLIQIHVPILVKKAHSPSVNDLFWMIPSLLSTFGIIHPIPPFQTTAFQHSGLNRGTMLVLNGVWLF